MGKRFNNTLVVDTICNLVLVRGEGNNGSGGSVIMMKNEVERED